MSALHSALQSLGPITYSSVPQESSDITSYLQTAFKDAQTIIDSVPLPPPAELLETRPRSSTNASTASGVSEISSSSARSELLDPTNVSLQKEWGKPIKLAPKDNPLNMSVFKLGGKDGKGAWFARRSVHEGLGFTKWKLGLEKEFPESLEVQGGPGEGNIRGIGGERRLDRKAVGGLGTMEVYHLSAQFPGPTTPRDFVTLLLTSSTALDHTAYATTKSSDSEAGKVKASRFSDAPRHFMVISRPCIHSECPPRDGFIRGQYESVEFIREIPRRPRKSASTADLLKLRQTSSSIDQDEVLSNGMQKAKEASESLPNGNLAPTAAAEPGREGRHRGKTISFAGSRGSSAKGEQVDNPRKVDDDELNPVEWVMITRSDPGGSVPRFMVERGTPSGIVSDASKFLDWACKKEHPEDGSEALESDNVDHVRIRKREELEAYNTNGHLAGLDGSKEINEDTNVPPSENARATKEPSAVQEKHSGGMMTSMANVAISGLETYAPQAVVDRLPGHQPSTSISASVASIKDTSDPNDTKDSTSTLSTSSASSIASFASAEDYFDDNLSNQTATSLSKSSNSKEMSPHEKELAKLNDRKRQLDEKLAKAKEKETKDKEDLTSKEEDRVRKAEEKHAREIAKQEEKYKKEVAKLEAKRMKDAAKDLDRRKKTADKDEKARLSREKEELRQQLEVSGKERDILKDQVRALQKENTSLVMRLGKMDDGKDVLREIRTEIHGEANRSRSGSLRKAKAATEEKEQEGKGKEATVLMGGAAGAELRKENLEMPPK